MKNRIERNDLKGMCSLEELKQVEKEENPVELSDDWLTFEVIEYNHDGDIINKAYIEAYKVKNNVDSAYELYTLKYAVENQPFVSIRLGYVFDGDFKKKEVTKFHSYELYHYGKYSDEAKIEIVSSERVQPLEKY